MKAPIPTLDELARVTGQDKQQLRRDAKAAAQPRTGASTSSTSAPADD